MADKLLVSFQTQIRIVNALIGRELITRYGRHNIGFMWMFVEPMMFTGGVILLWSFLKVGHSSAIPLIPFAVTGYSSVLLWRNMPNRTSGAVQTNLSLLYHRNVTVTDVFLSRIIVEAAGATISFAVLSFLFIMFGYMDLPEDMLLLLSGWVMLGWFGAALAIFMGALGEVSELVEKIWHPVTYLLFPLSGAMFMVDWLPSKMQEFVLYVPMVNGIEMVRGGFFGSVVNAHYNFMYLFLVCLILTIAGLYLTARVSERVIPE